MRRSIEEKKPIGIPGHKHVKPIRHDENLVGLVDTITKNNGGVSDAELARFLETSRASVNRIRHDLNNSYKPLLHAPFSTSGKSKTGSSFVETIMMTTGLKLIHG